MKKMILWFCVMSLISVSCSVAQVNTTVLSNAEEMGTTIYGLGFAAGWASGIGVSFRAHLPSKSSLQGVFGIIKTSNKLSLSIGGEYQYDLARTETTRFFVGPAISYFYHGVETNEIAGPLRIGMGVGAEFQVQGAFHITAEGMFVYFSDGRVIPLPQISAHFYFF